MADTLDEAKAVLVKRYEEVKRTGINWKATAMNTPQRFKELTYTMRPQDPHGDGTGLRFETGEHGSDYPMLILRSLPPCRRNQWIDSESITESVIDRAPPCGRRLRIGRATPWAPVSALSLLPL